MINILGLASLNEREALANLLDALSIAENAARQMGLLSEVPAWILLAERFSETRELCSRLGQASVASMQRHV